MENREVAAIAVQLGHTEVMIEPTASGRRWIVRCSCGWNAPAADGRPIFTRATFAQAVRDGQDHLRRAVARYVRDRQANGVSAVPFLTGRL